LCQSKIGPLFALNMPYVEKSLGMHPMVLLGGETHVEARFDPFGDRANLTQERCMICTEHTIGLEIVLDAQDETAW
jgi:hypothetical protein